MLPHVHSQSNGKVSSVQETEVQIAHRDLWALHIVVVVSKKGSCCICGIESYIAQCRCYEYIMIQWAILPVIFIKKCNRFVGLLS